MKLKLFYISLFLFIFYNLQAQKFPGGVTGAEVWYIANKEDISNQVFQNFSQTNIPIDYCNPYFGDALLNFNSAIGVDKLCLFYNANLENTTSRNIFFVGKPKKQAPPAPFSHITTNWNSEGVEDILELPEFDDEPSIENNFDFSNSNSHTGNLNASYDSDNNANVNFYHWNNYRLKRKYKSYGSEGETRFYIGKEFNFETEQSQEIQEYFIGRFPEFLSFPYELTDNEKNRVESYLALKYGITLTPNASYLNSKNVVFWDRSNNNLFPNNIFGIGRDDISGLNQLQSESVHKEKFLITSVEEFLPTNMEKQQHTIIPNDHFIVFGDSNGFESFATTNSEGVKMLHKKWLTQNTGVHAYKLSMHLWLNLEGVLQQSLIAGGAKLWMLHDKNVSNDEISDFDNNYVNYYEAANPSDFNEGVFKDVHFDTDNNVYDQFTFGIGPDMIVQVQYKAVKCGEKEIPTNILITGGKAPYLIFISENTDYEEEPIIIEENTYSFTSYAPAYSYILVKDDVGNVVELEFEVVPLDIQVDLGPDQDLSVDQQEITLDASLLVNDPEATYEWFKDGELLVGENESILIVDEVGNYKVIITSGDRSCKVADKIDIGFDFSGSIEILPLDCDDETGAVVLNIFGGFPNFTVKFLDLDNNGEEYLETVIGNQTQTFSLIDFGNYQVEVTDNEENVFVTQTINIIDPLEGVELNIYDQLANNCALHYNYFYGDQYNGVVAGECIQTSFNLNASLLVTNPNVSYEWFANGQLLNIFEPEVQIILNDENPSPPQTSALNCYEVIIINNNTGCIIYNEFCLKGYIIDDNLNNRSDIALDNESLKNNYNFSTTVYPNPSDPARTFYYEISSSKELDATVEVYSTQGSLLHQVKIKQKNHSRLPFQLSVAGVYFIRTTTKNTVKFDKVIIR